MMCDKGSTCKELSHEVLTLDGALSWHKSITVEMLPITINQLTANNGRVLITIFDNSGNLVHTRG